MSSGTEVAGLNIIVPKTYPELLYPSSEKHILLGTWNDTISKSPSTYTRFEVVRITHIKDLANWVWHEFLQAIIRDTANKTLIRILIERQPEGDFIIVGRWKYWTEGETPPYSSNETTLPLPLYTFEFDSPLALSSLTRVLVVVHNYAPNYLGYWSNCYWFAWVVYLALSCVFPGKEKYWDSFLLRACPPILKGNDTFNRVVMPFMTMKAVEFQKKAMKDPDNPTYTSEQYFPDDTSSDGETVTVIVPVTDETNPFWTKVQARLPKEQSELDKHREATGVSKIDISVVKFGVVIPGEVRSKFPDDYSYPKQVRDIYTSVLNSSSKDKYLQKATDNGYDKIAKSFTRTNMAEEYKTLVDSSSEDWLLTDDDCKKLNEAIKLQVGAVLTDLGK